MCLLRKLPWSVPFIHTFSLQFPIAHESRVSRCPDDPIGWLWFVTLLNQCDEDKAIANRFYFAPPKTACPRSPYFSPAK